MKLPLWAIALILACEATLIAVLVPGDWMKSTITTEQVYVAETIGEEERRYIEGKATEWFNETLVDTGFLHAMHRFLIPSEEEKAKSKGLENMGGWWFNFLEGRIVAFQYMAYHMFARLALLLTWLPYMAILLMPALYDGYNTWQIKKTNFDYSSPIIHRFSLKAAGMALVVMVSLFLSPFAMNPLIIPSVVMVSCAMLGIAVGNLQKRI